MSSILVVSIFREGGKNFFFATRVYAYCHIGERSLQKGLIVFIKRKSER